MDPEANVAEQRTLAARIRRMADQEDHDEAYRGNFVADATRLAELVQALDAWIVGGAFLPVSWGRTMPRTATPDTRQS